MILGVAARVGVVVFDGVVFDGVVFDGIVVGRVQDGVPSYAVARGVLADRVVPGPLRLEPPRCIDSCTISRKCVSSSLSSELQALDVSSALSTFAMAADAREHRRRSSARALGSASVPDDDPASGTAHLHADRPRREPRTRSASSPEHGLNETLGHFSP